MSTAYLHGVRLTIDDQAYIETRIMATDTIGVVCTAEDADPEVFPLNRCALVLDIKKAIAKAGNKGTLSETLQSIDAEVRAPVVVVRVAEGESEETIANIIGKVNDNDSVTGLKALALAPTQVGVTPRIFTIPLYDKSEAVAKALVEHAERQYGFAYMSMSHCENIADALVYRKKFANNYGMFFYGDIIKFNPQLAAEVEHYAGPALAGLRARLDQEKGWHYSISNKVLKGVTGLTKEVTYSGINGYGTGANTLNEAGISCFVLDDGYRTWGNRTTAGPDSSMYFEVFARSSQVAAITLANLLKNMTQDQPMNPARLDQFKQRGDAILYDWQRAGRILGGEIILHPELNGDDALMSGRPDWLLELTAVPPIESPGLTVRLSDKFIKNAVGG